MRNMERRARELTMACWWPSKVFPHDYAWSGIVGELQGVVDEHPETPDAAECLDWAMAMAALEMVK